ncbi:septal ring lytic transglycosylase RlpA family protein [Ferruginibacter sp.]|jgi:rare lipoprotein A|nr:septal ring lytic transglycosylase RlpA family protein [Ferruginibacter sp.]
MKPHSSAQKKIVQLALVLITAIVFIAPLKTFAQQADTATKAKSSKSKRVLYGQASFYANKFEGRKTANGEIFSQKKLTCACNVLPLGTWIRVTNLRNGRTVVVKTNDRLHPRMKRIIDLSKAAAVKLGYVGAGLTRVKIEVLGKKAP